MAILWTEVKRNERPDFLSTVEGRLRASGVLDALYLARVENTRFYYGETNRECHADVGPNNQGENAISSDV